MTTGGPLDLERFPRFALGHWPTPMERLERLSQHLGPTILVKRDDCTGLALGGNKVRKLEYLIAEAKAQGADQVITMGGVQSNHARQTAAAAARAGLRCDLVLPRLVPRRDPLYEENGNVLLDRLLGATVHIVEDAEAALVRAAELVDAAKARGGEAAFFPAGGSTPTGALGYVRAAGELLRQLEELRVRVDRIVLAVSSCGTQAGLVTGLSTAGSKIVVEGVAVYDSEENTRRTLRDLADRTAELLGTAPPPDAEIHVIGCELGEGYGLSTDLSREALQTCARLEGILLDPVYTAKGMAGLFRGVRSGRIGANETVLFWHTGGMPALFAYG